MKLALCQLDSRWEDPQFNLGAFGEAVDRYVAERGAPDLLVFPECFNTAYTFNLDFAEPASGGPTLETMVRKAEDAGCAIAGSAIVEEDGRYFNRCYFVTENGEIHSYDKRHAFSYSGEDKVISCGSGRTVLNYRGWNIALTVCYDLRFPVWMRNEGNSYDLMLTVASWPASRSIFATRMLPRGLLKTFAIWRSATAPAATRTAGMTAARTYGTSAESLSGRKWKQPGSISWRLR